MIILFHNSLGDQDSIGFITSSSLECGSCHHGPRWCHQCLRQQAEKGVREKGPRGHSIHLLGEAPRGYLMTVEFIFYQREVSPLAILTAKEAAKLIFILSSNMLS